MRKKRQLIKAKIYPIQLEKKLTKLEAKREKLFTYYQNRCDRFITITYISKKEGQGVKQRNLEDEKRLYYQDIRSILPRHLIKIAHDGVLKILALSDYRVHDIGALVNFVNSLKDKPDIIVYAGDDIRRFSPTPSELIRIPIRSSTEEFPEEIEAATVSFPDGDKWISSVEYGLLLRLPCGRYTEEQIRERLSMMLKMTSHIYEILKNSSTQPKGSEIVALKELVIRKYSFLIIQEDEKEVKIIDKHTNTLVLSLQKFQGSRLIPWKGYWNMLGVQLNKNTNFSIKKIGEDKKFVYFYIVANQPGSNIFEKLASHARYGLAAVIGNDDSRIVRAWIRGDGVYELHNTWLKIGSFLIIGLEGSTCGMGPSGKYPESDVKLRLELASEMLEPNDKLIVVSHTPPRGLLDRAMRFGEEAIGSLALRDFVEECDRLALVICGHVHRCGGRFEKLNKVTVVNVSSHDNPFDQANVAWVVIDEEAKTDVNFIKLSSLIERIFKNENEDQLLEVLKERAFLTEAEAQLFIGMFEKLGEKLFSDLSELANFKFHYGFSWHNVFHLYTHGVKSPEQLTDAIYKEVLNSTSRIHKVHLMRGYAKVKRETEKEKIYLIHRIPLPSHNRMIVYDTEYSGEVGVLYGFLDLTTGELKQFWFDEKEKAREYLKEKKDHLFVHWGGSDKKILREELNCDATVLNLLYYVQISLVAPISSATLRNTLDILCGREENDWWKKSFYELDGIDKLMLCNHILMNPNDNNVRRQLKDANSADILALNKIVAKLRELNSC